jgi:hypothetical protein
VTNSRDVDKVFGLLVDLTDHNVSPSFSHRVDTDGFGDVCLADGVDRDEIWWIPISAANTYNARAVCELS